MTRFLLLLLLNFGFFRLSGQVAPNPFAHMHNDYEKRPPLFRALKHGFASIEVDLFFHRNRLVVSHIPFALRLKPGFRELYLEPLRKIVQENGGTVFPGDSTPLILYLDFKNYDGTYEAVRSLVLEYSDLFTLWKNDTLQWGPVELLIDHFYDKIPNENPRFARIQGSLDKASLPLSPELMPRLNAHFPSRYGRLKKTGLKEEKLNGLRKDIATARENGRTIRFYRTPNRAYAWDFLLKENPGWINVDRTKRFRKFYEKRASNN